MPFDAANANTAHIALGKVRPGQAGVIVGVETHGDHQASLTADERLRRLLEFGFVEGARVAVLHEGLVGGDPIAVRVDDTRIALRRALADSVLVRLD